MFTSDPLDKSLPNYPSRYYEQIIASINRAISRGDLKPGDKLPSERELATLFDTSRIPVREAIKILEFCGIVAPVSGGGIVVQNIEISQLLNKIYFALDTTDDTLRELFEIRLLLESYAAEKAARIRTEDDLKELKSALEAMEHNLEAGELPYANSHLFHDIIIKAAGNVLLKDLYRFLYSLLNISRTRTLADLQHLPKALEYHKKIYECILAQDSGQAKICMEEHLLNEIGELKGSKKKDNS